METRGFEAATASAKEMAINTRKDMSAYLGNFSTIGGMPESGLTAMYGYRHPASTPAFDTESSQLLQELEQMARVVNIVVPVVIVIILVLGLIGNALVVYVTVVTNRTAKHPIHSLFVLNLAAADVLFLLVCAPYWITISSVSGWHFGSFLCPLIPFLANCSMAASIYTICALAWMRFMALVMPFRFRRSRISTRKAGYFVILSIWIAGIILSIPNLVYYGLREVSPPGDAVFLSCEWYGQTALRAFACVKLAVTYILPLILVSVFYAVIGREVLCYMMHHGTSLNRGPGGRTNTEEQKECAKSTMVVLSLILAFLICWFPHLLESMFMLTGFNSGLCNGKSRFILETFGKCMSYAHACVNPFIYTFASPIFRRSLRTSIRQNLQNCHKGNVCGRSCSNKITGKHNGTFKSNRYTNVHDTTNAGQEYNVNQNALVVSTATEGPTGRTEQIHVTSTLDPFSLHPNSGPVSPESPTGPQCALHSLQRMEVSSEAAEILLDQSNKVDDGDSQDLGQYGGDTNGSAANGLLAQINGSCDSAINNECTSMEHYDEAVM